MITRPEVIRWNYQPLPPPVHPPVITVLAAPVAVETIGFVIEETLDELTIASTIREGGIPDHGVAYGIQKIARTAIIDRMTMTALVPHARQG